MHVMFAEVASTMASILGIVIGAALMLSSFAFALLCRFVGEKVGFRVSVLMIVAALALVVISSPRI